MLNTPAERVLRPTPASIGQTAVDLLQPLRDALSGAGPALALLSPDTPAGPDQTLPADVEDPSDPVAVTVTTSGSTGSAKTVVLPASALLASASATHDRLGGAGQWLLAVPTHHVAGLQVLVRSLVAGTRPVALDGGQFTPSAFVSATRRLRADRARYTSLVPTQLVRLLSDVEAIAALRSFQTVLIGGSGTPAALLAKAQDAGITVVTTYGMSETCGGCVYDQKPLDGVQVRLEEGRILLGGPQLARGYLGAPQQTAEAFVQVDGERWFRTDDAGAYGFGSLVVLGRLDDMIISGGTNVAPAPVEELLHEWPQIREACVVGVPDDEWGQRVGAAVVLTSGLAAPSLADVRARIRSVLGPASAPRQLSVLPELPLRGPGKPDRSAISRLLSLDPDAQTSS